MPEERRINLRVSREEYEAFNKKRFAEQTTFQEVGIGLFRDWLKGERKPDPPTEADTDVERLLELKRIGAKEDIEAIKANIRVFWRDARRALARKQKEA